MIYPVKTGSNTDGILVSGASGMLGTALRQALAARLTRVVQLVRHEPRDSAELQWNPGAPVPLALPESLNGLAAAIHLSGASVAGRRWTPAYKREMAESRVRSTAILAAALAALRQPPRTLLVASAVGIYGDRRDEILDEKSSPGKGFLADLCVDWEAAAQSAVAAGIRVVHLRFGVVLGRGGGALARLLPLFRLGLGGRLGSGEAWMSWIHLDDAVAALLFALESPSLDGPANVTAPAPVTNAGFTRALGRAVHRPAILPVPAFGLRLAFGQMANEALLASQRAVPAKLSSLGFRFTHPSVDTALIAIAASGRD